MKKMSDLRPMIEDIPPITLGERQSRLEKARRLMVENGMDAIWVPRGVDLEGEIV